MLPARRPRLMAERRDEQVRAERESEVEQARERGVRIVAERAAREYVRRRRANSRVARVARTIGGWVLSILGALIVSLALTWLVRHPQAIDSLARLASTFLRRGGFERR